jgi:hypothetical protein
VLRETLGECVQHCLRNDIEARVLREANVDRQVEEAYTSLLPIIEAQAETMQSKVASEMAATPEQPWTAPVLRAAAAIIEARR